MRNILYRPQNKQLTVERHPSVLGIYKRKKESKKTCKKTQIRLRKKNFKKRSRSRKQALDQETVRENDQEKKKYIYFLDAFLAESVFFFSWTSFFSWKNACILEQVHVFLNECVFSCCLTFVFSFTNFQPCMIHTCFFSLTPSSITVLLNLLEYPTKKIKKTDYATIRYI